MESTSNFKPANIHPGRITRAEMFQGGVMPFSLQKEDEWDLIMKVVPPLDRLSLCRTNSQLDQVFGASKSEWLLGPVLPFVMKHLTNKDHVLKCRQVCKTWRNQVDHFLEYEHPCRRPFNGNNPLEQMFSRMPAIYSSLARWNLEFSKFTLQTQHKLVNYSGNPDVGLIGRAVCFDTSAWNGNVAEIEEFLNIALSFLKVRGDKIWHFKFVQYSQHLTLNRFYPVLCEFLSLLPNLRTLKIRCDLDLLPRQKKYVQITPLILEHSLPNLKFLHSIDIDILPDKLQNHFVNHFESTLKQMSLKQEEDICIPSQLVNLELKSKDLDTNFLSRLTAPRQTFPIHLQKLSLVLSYPGYISMPQLLQIFAQCPNLTQFHLTLQGFFAELDSDYENFGNLDIDFEQHKAPSVTYFEYQIDGGNIFDCGELLPAFPNLKYLHLRDNTEPGYENFCRKTSRQQMKTRNFDLEFELYLCENIVEFSPVWDTLKNLQVLTVASLQGSCQRFCSRAQANWQRETKGMKAVILRKKLKVKWVHVKGKNGGMNSNESTQ